MCSPCGVVQLWECANYILRESIPPCVLAHLHLQSEQLLAAVVRLCQATSTC